MATVVGVLLVVLVLIGVPLANFDGTAMWAVSPPTAPGRLQAARRVGEAITTYLGVAHGWLYMIFLVTAFLLSRRAGWSLALHGRHPRLRHCPAALFWAERRVDPPAPRRAPRAGPPRGGPVTTAFVLGGGGVLGAVEVGMLRALLERDIAPDLVLGTSVGALNGAAGRARPRASPSSTGSPSCG